MKLADDDAVIEGDAPLPEGKLHGFSAILCDSPEGTTPVGFNKGLDAPLDETPTLAALELMEGDETRGFLWVTEGGYSCVLDTLDAAKALPWNKGITGYHPMHMLPIAKGSTVRVIREDSGAFPASTWLILNFWMDVEQNPIISDGYAEHPSV